MSSPTGLVLCRSYGVIWLTHVTVYGKTYTQYRDIRCNILRSKIGLDKFCRNAYYNVNNHTAEVTHELQLYLRRSGRNHCKVY